MSTFFMAILTGVAWMGLTADIAWGTFAVGAVPIPASLGLRPAAGHTHGDLHGYNVLVRTRDQDTDWFLIDVAFYDPDQFLFFDHAYFELSHLLETRAAEPAFGAVVGATACSVS